MTLQCVLTRYIAGFGCNLEKARNRAVSRSAESVSFKLHII